MNQERVGTEGLERQHELLDEWLGESRFCAQIISAIDEALALLAAKRTTLEEKIIKRELHTCVHHYARLLVKLHESLANDKEPKVELLEQLRTLNFRVHAVIGDLLRALRYNLNYVEQYFEFDFSSRLTQEHQFAEELAKLVESF